MTTWHRSLSEELATTTILGRRLEIVAPGSRASPKAEVVVVTGGRVADVTLRGRAATPQGREKVRTFLEGLPQISRVLDPAALEAMHASDKLGDFLVEAKTPWGFGPRDRKSGRHGAVTVAPWRCGCRS